MSVFRIDEFDNYGVQIEKLTAQRDELFAALKPFAEFARHYPMDRTFGNRPTSGVILAISSGIDDESEITVEDLHRAKEAIAKAEA